MQKALSELKNRLNQIYFIVTYIMLVLAMIKIFSLLIPTERDYDLIISIVEKGAIIIATIAVLTFTYALTLDYPKKKLVTKSGKYFLKSVLNFIIGMIFLIGFRDYLDNPINTFGLLDLIFNFTTIIIFLLFSSGLLILISSAYFFAIGITDLLKSL